MKKDKKYIISEEELIELARSVWGIDTTIREDVKNFLVGKTPIPIDKNSTTIAEGEAKEGYLYSEQNCILKDADLLFLVNNGVKKFEDKKVKLILEVEE